MKRRTSLRAVMILSLLTVGIGLAVVPQTVRPMLTSAQTVVIGIPVAACGQVSAYSPSPSTTGHITLSNTNVVTDFVTAPGLVVQSASQPSIGTDVCLVGNLNTSNQLVGSVALLPDQPTQLTMCGIISAYTAAQVGALGSISITNSTSGSSTTYVIPIAYGASFNGAVPLNGNECVQLNLNGVGQIAGGTITPNTSGQVSNGTPVSICGQVTYVAPTATAAGTLSFSTVNVNATYGVAAGHAINPAPATGQQLCFVGTVSPSHVITGGLITTNATTVVTTCGVVTAYIAATTTTRGALTIGGTVLPLAYGASFNGNDLGSAAAAHANECVSAMVDALSEFTGGSVSANTNVTATPTPTATTSGNPGPPPPPPPAFGTATPTPTVTLTPTSTPTTTPVPPPTATPTVTPTATATATATPVPPPPSAPYKPTFKKISVRYGTMRIGDVETVTVQAKKKAKHGIRMHVVFATGRRFDFNESTNSKGHWTKSFRIPTNTISGYSHQAQIELELFYKSKVARTYRTFDVVR